MAIKRRKFNLGIRLKPTTEVTTLEGELRIDPSDMTFKVFLDGAERGMVLADSTQTLQNKTFDETNTFSGSIENPTRLDPKKDTQDNLEIYAVTAQDGELVFATDTLKSFQVVEGELRSIGGGATSFDIEQVAHGLSVGDGIYHNGTSFVKGLANDSTTLAYHVVTQVADVDNFSAADFGRIESEAHGFTVGEYYFLSEVTAGLPTITAPTVGFSNPLFYVETADILQIKCLRPNSVGDAFFLNEITNVEVPTPTESQALVYNDTTSLWEARTLQASEVANTPLGDLVSSNVQDAINELNTKLTQNSTDTTQNETDITSINDSIGVANGIAPLDSNAKIAPIHLPSYVDDVEEYADLASFPVTGESGKIYVALDTLKTYRWSSTVYAEISPSEVNSVNGNTGIVTLDNTDIGLPNVTDDAQLKRDSGDFATFIEKEEPVKDDIVLIEDSEDLNSKKTVKLSNLLGSGQGGINYLGKNGDADNGLGDWISPTVSAISIEVRDSNALVGEADFKINTGIVFLSSGSYVETPFSIPRAYVGFKQLVLTGVIEFDSGYEENALKLEIVRASDNASLGYYDLTGNEYEILMPFYSDTTETDYKLRVVKNINGATADIYLDTLVIKPLEITKSTGKTSWTIRFDSTIDPDAFLNEGGVALSITRTGTGLYRIYFKEGLFPSDPIVDVVTDRVDGSGPYNSTLAGFGEDTIGRYIEVLTINGTAVSNLTGTDIAQVTFTQKEEDQTAFQISTDLGNREITFEGGQPLANVSTNGVIRFSSEIDTIGMYNEDTGEWTIEETGSYLFDGAVQFTGTGNVSIFLYINGVQDSALYSGGGYVIRKLNIHKRLNRGDIVKIVSLGAGTFSSTETNHISVTKQSNNTPFLAPLTPEIAIFKDVKPSGTNGGSAVAGSYQTRDLNTHEGLKTFASLDSNQITLEKGKYLIEASSLTFAVLDSKCKIYNVTDSEDLIVGMIARPNSAGEGNSSLNSLTGEITINKTTTIDLRIRTRTTRVIVGLGNASIFGDDEVYSTVKIQKIY